MEIGPAQRRLDAVGSLYEVLESLAEYDEITRVSLRTRRGKWRAQGLGFAAGSAGALLDEIRSDRGPGDVRLPLHGYFRSITVIWRAAPDL